MEERDGEGEPRSLEGLPESVEWRPNPMPLESEEKPVRDRRRSSVTGLPASLSLLAPELEPLRGFKLVRAFFSDMVTTGSAQSALRGVRAERRRESGSVREGESGQRSRGVVEDQREQQKQ